MGITNSNKEISKKKIKCNESFNVKLSLSSVPNIQNDPVDVVLVLDNSFSMKGTPIYNLKLGAKEFIRLFDASTSGGENGVIGNGNRIGIVTFSDVGVKKIGLTSDVEALNQAVTTMSADGSTNHSDAFEKAISMFEDFSPNSKVIIMFTDGKTTVGPDANVQATLAKEAGIIIYCIGLDNSSLDQAALNLWASQPSSDYVSIAPDANGIEELFAKIVADFTTPGALNIVVKDTINPCFKVTQVFPPTKGTAKKVDDNNVEWNIDELGVTGNEDATFTFEVQHIGPCEGLIEVNDSIIYTDTVGNEVEFPSPKINVVCNPTDVVEDCPEPIDVNIDGCEDFVDVDAGSINLDSLGRILQLNVKLKNVCPNRRVALATIVTEVDEQGTEYDRGIKIMTIPAHTRRNCQDVLVRCIKFVLPENLDVSGQTDAMCNPRSFKARFIAHYIDTNVNFDCCDPVE